MTELKRMHEVRIEQPHPIERLGRIGIGLFLLCAQPAETEAMRDAEIERVPVDVKPLRIADL